MENILKKLRFVSVYTHLTRFDKASAGRVNFFASASWRIGYKPEEDGYTHAATRDIMLTATRYSARDSPVVSFTNLDASDLIKGIIGLLT